MTAKTNLCGCLVCFLLLLVSVKTEFGAGSPVLGGKTLIIGVPKKFGFKEFVDARLNPNTNQLIDVTGYSIDVFEAAVDYLTLYCGFNVSYKFEAFVDQKGQSAGTYDQLVQQIPKHKYDAVVGDVSIVANRSQFVDFTLPYAESGVRMIVPVQHARHLNMWIFLEPFSWDLWLSFIIVCVFIGAVIRFMERNINNSEDDLEGSLRRQKFNRLSIIWLPLAQMVLPERESVVKNCSKFVLVVWLILAFVLMQSYTASLSSILTLVQLQLSYPSVNDLQRNGENIGYPSGSFVFNLLVDELKFDPTKLKNISTIDDYHEALKNGTRKGGVAVIFDDIPRIKVFLKKYGSKYRMAGPRHRTDGFAFVFPTNSNLTSYFSRAILNVTQSDKIEQIEKKYFGSSNYDDEMNDQSGQSLSDSQASLTTYSFAGLFMLTGIATLFALLVSESHIWQKPVTLAKIYSRKYLFSPSSSRSIQSMHDFSSRGNVSTHPIDVEANEQAKSPSGSPPSPPNTEDLLV